MRRAIPDRGTRWTDANGNLKDAHKGSWELGQIEAAERAGIPAHWLLTNGSDVPTGSDEWQERGELDGCWSDLLYELGCRLRGVDHAERPLRRNMSRTLDHLRWLVFLAEKVGASSEAIPWDVYDFRLRVYALKTWRMPAEHAERLEAIDAEGLARLAEETSGMWGHPTGPDHDNHAHGLARDVWRCLTNGNGRDEHDL